MDLFCEFTVVNRSELTLHVSAQESTHGSWDFHGTGLIHPTEFGRFTAKDPAGAAFGSEGWVTFADETGCTFSIAYCCSYKKEGNYAFLVEHSPLLDVVLRFGNEVPPVAADKFWGRETFPKADHPLGILVHVEQRPAKRSLSVMTFDAHLLEGAKGAEAWRLLRDPERADELLRRLESTDSDVICLQNSWTLVERHLISTFAAYPFVFPFSQEAQVSTGSWWDSWYKLFEFLPIAGKAISMSIATAQLASMSAEYAAVLKVRMKEGLANTGGLLVLSRYPLIQGTFSAYAGSSGADAPLNRRGRIDLTVGYPADARTAASLRIGTTLGPSEPRSAQLAIGGGAGKALAEASQDRILLGNFRVPVSNETEISSLDAALGRHGATDLVRRFLPDLEAAYTQWPAGNSFNLESSRSRGLPAPEAGKDRSDYVYFAPRAKAPFLEPASVSVLRDWEIREEGVDRSFTTFSISSHYPVVARFDVAVPDIAPYPRFHGHEETSVSLAEVEVGKYTLALPYGARTAPDGDLYCVRRTGNPSGRIDLRLLDGSSGWKRIKTEIPTRLLPSEEASYRAFLLGDYGSRNEQDLFALKSGGTQLKVEVLDSKPPRGNAYWDFLLERGVPIQGAEIPDFEFFLGHYNSEGRPDLFCLKHRNTSRGKLEVHILSGTSQYQNFALQTETTLPVDPSGRQRYGVARFRRARGNSDVLVMKPGARNVQVQVFDGTRGYRPLAAEFETALPAADMPNFDFFPGDCAEAALSGPLYCLKRRNSSHGKLEVHSIGRRVL